MKLRAVVLSIFFLCCPGRSDAQQLPPCVPIDVLQMHVQHKSEPVFMNIFRAYSALQAPSQARVLEHILKGKPCQTPGFIRWKNECYSAARLRLIKK